MPRPTSLRALAFGGFRRFPRIRKEWSMFRISQILAAALAFGLFGASAPAAEKPTLTVYTYSGFSGEYGPGGKIKERFEATCACALEWVEGDDAGRCSPASKLEGASTKADVVLGLDNNQIADAEATGLFVPMGSTSEARSSRRLERYDLRSL
jgi:thiamine transport system substrate-binding protein